MLPSLWHADTKKLADSHDPLWGTYFKPDQMTTIWSGTRYRDKRCTHPLIAIVHPKCSQHWTYWHMGSTLIPSYCYLLKCDTRQPDFECLWREAEWFPSPPPPLQEDLCCLWLVRQANEGKFRWHLKCPRGTIQAVKCRKEMFMVPGASKDFGQIRAAF